MNETGNSRAFGGIVVVSLHEARDRQTDVIISVVDVIAQECEQAGDGGVEPDRDAVLHALTYSQTIVSSAGKTQEYHVVDFLNGGDGYLSSNGKSYKNSDINLGDLIVYENWQKE